MKSIYWIKRFVLYFALIAYVYLWSCRLWFENSYVSLLIQVPYLLLFIVDICVLWSHKKDVRKIMGYYFCKNKLLFLGIALFVLYDVLTLFYAVTLSYSINKYMMFVRTIFLIGSIFLCCYENDDSIRKKNEENLIRCICFILIVFVITTIIRWSLGLSPFLMRISLRMDYNVYAAYFLFALTFYIFYYMKREESFFGSVKLIYLIFVIISCDFIYLSASRRALILCPIVVTISLLFYVVRKTVKYKNSHIKVWNTRNIKSYVMMVCFVIVLVVNFKYSIPIFEKYISTVSEEKKEAHKNFMRECLSTGQSNGQTNGQQTVNISETSISKRYESVKSEEGMVSRQNIWKVSIAGIKEFDLKEIVFGKGNGYSWNIYENDEDEEVRELLDLYGMEKSKPQWMMPHNFILTEFLEGGLLKILLILFLTIAIIYSLFQYIKTDNVYGCMFLLLYFCFAANFMLGTTHGLLGEDLFWLTTGLLILFRSNETMVEKNIFRKKE